MKSEFNKKTLFLFQEQRKVFLELKEEIMSNLKPVL